ncbi:MAG: hypothetical protein ACYCPP_06310 [Nitrososphaerales archaeon]
MDNSLNTFINAVNAQSGKQIPTPDAQTRVSYAEEIINSIV